MARASLGANNMLSTSWRGQREKAENNLNFCEKNLILDRFEIKLKSESYATELTV